MYYLDFPRFPCYSKKVNKRKHVEKESTFIGTLQRDSQLIESGCAGMRMLTGQFAEREWAKISGRWLWSGRDELLQR